MITHRMAHLVLASSALAVVAIGCLGCLGCKSKSDTRAGAVPNAIGGGPSVTTNATTNATQNATSTQLLPGATCGFPPRIERDTTIAAGCVVDIVGNVLLENGSTLTIEPGVTLRFGEAAYLEIGHDESRLVARGTEEQPIVFTSGAATKRPGDWVGLVFEDAIGEKGSILEHVVVEYAGRDSHGGRGAITVFTAFAEGRLSLRDVAFRHNNLAAIDDELERATFGAFERVRFENDALAMKVAAPILARIGDGDGVDFGGDAIVVTGGTIARSGNFPRTRAPIVVERPISVAGGTLTIASGDTLKFAKGTWLEVGVAAPGALEARGVSFDSAEPDPKSGDWVGILFGAGANGSHVAGCVIDHAGGEDHGGDGAITFLRPWQGLDVGIYGNAFEDNAQSQLSDGGEGCNKLLDPKNGNSFGGTVEPCR
jgi:hypothetical protein